MNSPRLTSNASSRFLQVGQRMPFSILFSVLQVLGYFGSKLNKAPPVALVDLSLQNLRLRVVPAACMPRLRNVFDELVRCILAALAGDPFKAATLLAQIVGLLGSDHEETSQATRSKRNLLQMDSVRPANLPAEQHARNGHHLFR